MNPLEIINMLKSAKDIITGVNDEKRKDDAKYDEALKAVTLAVFKTRIYLRNFEETKEHNWSTEETLVEYWNDASVKLRTIAPSLALDCNVKAFYWADPDKNTPKVVRKLDDIFADCLELISPKKNELFNQNELNLLGLN